MPSHPAGIDEASHEVGNAAPSLVEDLIPITGLPALTVVGRQRETSGAALRRRGILVIYLGCALSLVALATGMVLFREQLGVGDGTAYFRAILLVLLAVLLIAGGNAHVLFLRAHSLGPTSGSGHEADDEIPRDVTTFAQVARPNQRLIATYHSLTTAQASSSYRNSQIAMAVGLLILAGGGAATFNSRESSAQVVLGVLTGLGSAFSAYLGATFLSAYNRALQQMNYYFGQPLANSYLLTAERLVKELSDQKLRDSEMKEVIGSTLDGASLAFRAIAPDMRPPRLKRTRKAGERQGPQPDPASSRTADHLSEGP